MSESEKVCTLCSVSLSSCQCVCIKRLGKGTYGSVLHVKVGGTTDRALKVMEPTNVLGNLLGRPLTVPLHGCVSEGVEHAGLLPPLISILTRKRELAVLFPLAVTDCSQFIQKFRGDRAARYAFAQHVARDVCASLCELHASGYMHCDITPSNILLMRQKTAEGSIHFTRFCALSDPSLLQRFRWEEEEEEDGGIPLDTCIVAPYYRPPEVRAHEWRTGSVGGVPPPPHLTDRVDIWSLGTVIVELLRPDGEILFPFAEGRSNGLQHAEAMEQVTGTTWPTDELGRLPSATTTKTRKRCKSTGRRRGNQYAVSPNTTTLSNAETCVPAALSSAEPKDSMSLSSNEVDAFATQRVRIGDAAESAPKATQRVRIEDAPEGSANVPFATQRVRIGDAAESAPKAPEGSTNVPFVTAGTAVLDALASKAEGAQLVERASSMQMQSTEDAAVMSAFQPLTEMLHWFPADALSFCSACLTLSPLKRPSARQLLDHPFITSLACSPSCDCVATVYLNAFVPPRVRTSRAKKIALNRMLQRVKTGALVATPDSIAVSAPMAPEGSANVPFATQRVRIRDATAGTAVLDAEASKAESAPKATAGTAVLDAEASKAHRARISDVPEGSANVTFATQRVRIGDAAESAPKATQRVRIGDATAGTAVFDAETSKAKRARIENTLEGSATAVLDAEALKSPRIEDASTQTTVEGSRRRTEGDNYQEIGTTAVEIMPAHKVREYVDQGIGKQEVKRALWLLYVYTQKGHVLTRAIVNAAIGAALCLAPYRCPPHRLEGWSTTEADVCHLLSVIGCKPFIEEVRAVVY